MLELARGMPTGSKRCWSPRSNTSRTTGLAERATGVGLDQWLASVGRQTRTDRRMVQTAAKVLRRLPSVQTAFDDGRLSWSQVRTLVLKVNDLPRHLDDRLDAALADAVATVHGDDGEVRTDPDALAHVVTWVLADLHEGDPDDTTVRGGRPAGVAAAAGWDRRPVLG